MCATLYFYFYIPYSVLISQNLVSIHCPTVDPLYPFHLPPYLFPSGNHFSVLCVYVSTCLFLFALFIYFCLFVLYISHMSEIIWYLSSSIWLTSLSIIPSKSIHFVANPDQRIVQFSLFLNFKWNPTLGNFLLLASFTHCHFRDFPYQCI